MELGVKGTTPVGMLWFCLLMMLCCAGCGKVGLKPLTYSEITIPVDFPYVEKYEGRGDIWERNDTFVWGVYNRFGHSIDYYDLTNGLPIRTVSLSQQGYDVLNNVRDWYVGDTLIVCRNGHTFFTLDGKGRMISEWDVDHLIDPITNKKYALDRGGVKLGNYAFSVQGKADGCIYIQTYPTSKSLDECYALAEFDVKKESVKFLPVFYPKEVDRNVLQSDYSSLYFQKEGNMVYYSFPYSFRVYSVDISCSKKDEYRPKSVLVQDDFSLETLPGSPPERMKCEMNSQRFGPVHLLDGTVPFVRIIYAKLGHGETSRERSLMLLDKKFKAIAEYALPVNFSDYYCVCGQNIFFQLSDVREGQLRLARVDVNALAK